MRTSRSKVGSAFVPVTKTTLPKDISISSPEVVSAKVDEEEDFNRLCGPTDAEERSSLSSPRAQEQCAQIQLLLHEFQELKELRQQDQKEREQERKEYLNRTKSLEEKLAYATKLLSQSKQENDRMKDEVRQASEATAAATARVSATEAAKDKAAGATVPDIQIQLPPANVSVQRALEWDAKRFVLAKFVTQGNATQLQTSLDEWLVKLATAASAAGEVVAEMTQTQRAAAEVFWESWVEAPPEERVLTTEQPPMTKAQIEAHGAIAPLVAAATPIAVQRHAHAQARQRGGAEIWMVDLLFMMLRQYKISTHKGIKNLLKQLTETSTCKNSGFCAFLDNFEAQLKMHEENYLTDSNYADYMDNLEQMTSGRSQRMTLFINTQVLNNPKPFPIVHKQYFWDWFRKLRGMADHEFGHLLPGQDEEESKDKSKVCTHCSAKKGRTVTGHTKQECQTFRREQSERDRASHEARLTDEEKKKKSGSSGNGSGGNPNRSAESKAKFPCALAIKGNCTAGEKCNFSHDPELLKSYREKKCKNGANCSFNKAGRCIFGVHLTDLIEAGNDVHLIEENDVQLTENHDDEELVPFDTCANVPTAQALVRRATGDATVNTSGGPVPAKRGAVMTPFGEEDGVAIKMTRPVYPVCRTIDRRFGFTWTPSDFVPACNPPEGPALWAENKDDGKFYPRSLPVENGKPMISTRLVEESKQAAETKTPMIAENLEACWTCIAEDAMHRAQEYEVFNTEVINGNMVGDCFICGGDDHYAAQCLNRRLLQSIGHGMQTFEALPEKIQSIVRKYLAKIAEAQMPQAFWSASADAVEPPVFKDDDSPVLDMLLDKTWNVLAVERGTASCGLRSGLKELKDINGRPIQLMRLYLTVPDIVNDEGDVMLKGGMRVSFESQLTEAYHTQTGRAGILLDPRESKEDIKKQVQEFLDERARLIKDIEPQAAEHRKKQEIINQGRKGLHTHMINLLVDDCALGAPENQHAAAWKEIPLKGSVPCKVGRGGIVRYSGAVCAEYTTGENDAVKIYTLDQAELMMKAVQDFQAQTGIKIVGRRSDLPMPPVPKKYGKEEVVVEEKMDPMGVLGDIAVHFVLQLAYAQQMSRPDLSVVIQYLEQCFTQWTVREDIILIQLMRYAWTKAFDMLVWVVDSRDLLVVRGEVLPDASAAGCKRTRRSLLGAGVAFVGPGTFALVSWRTKLSTSVLDSSMASEGASLLLATKDGITLSRELELLCGLTQVGVDGVDDNKGLVQVCKKGGLSTALASYKRSDGIRLAALSDFYALDPNTLGWQSGKLFLPDGLTKPLDKERFAVFKNQVGVLGPRMVEEITGQNINTEEVQIKEAQLTDAEIKDLKEEKQRLRRDQDERLRKYRKMLGGDDRASMALNQRICAGENVPAQRMIATQSRAHHSHKGIVKRGQDAWRVDTHGPQKPTDPQRVRYILSMRDLMTWYLKPHLLESKHPAKTRIGAEKFAQMLKRTPAKTFRDGGKEFGDEWGQWERENLVEPKVSPRYSPWENGGAEVDVRKIFEEAITALEIGHMPPVYWARASEFGADVENILTGAWAKVHGEASAQAAVQRLRPFGAAQSGVKEQPEQAMAKGDIQNRAFRGFHCGVNDDGTTRLGIFMSGRFKVIATRNVRDLPGFYFDEVPPGAREAMFRGAQMLLAQLTEVPLTPAKAEDLHTDTREDLIYFFCDLCGAGRLVKDAKELELETIHDICCNDIGRRCGCGDDVKPAGVKVMEPYDHLESFGTCLQSTSFEAYVTQSLSQREALKSDQCERAIKKELDKYEQSDAYSKEVYNWYDIVKRTPKEKRGGIAVVRLALIWVWKFAELSRELWELACRICALGDQMRDGNGELTTGIAKEENLYLVPPSPKEWRLFRLAVALTGGVISTNDFLRAYLQTDLNAKLEIYAELPEVMQGEEDKNIKANGGRPVRRVKKAIYGLPRAGQDYCADVTARLKSLQYQNLRDLESTAGQFVRHFDKDGKIVQVHRVVTLEAEARAETEKERMFGPEFSGDYTADGPCEKLTISVRYEEVFTVRWAGGSTKFIKQEDAPDKRYHKYTETHHSLDVAVEEENGDQYEKDIANKIAELDMTKLCSHPVWDRKIKVWRQCKIEAKGDSCYCEAHLRKLAHERRAWRDATA